MAKELPYFRFTPSEWQNGNISLEDYELQGLFVQICCYYWISDCSITITMLKKRFRNDINLIDKLIENNIFVVDENTEFVSINFLNEQFDVLSEARSKRQKAGSIGGMKRSSNAKAKLKQCSSYNDNNKDKDKEKETLTSCFLFSEFWKIYPNKNGKAESEKKYNKLSETDKQIIKNTINNFINNPPFKDYNFPMATTYINQKRWLDENPVVYEYKQSENNGVIRF